MKNFKKVIAASVVFGMLPGLFGVNAKKIVDEDRMFSEVQSSVVISAVSLANRENPGGRITFSYVRQCIAYICINRMEIMGRILIGGGIDHSEVPKVIDEYLSDGYVICDSYEAKQLRESFSPRDLRYNFDLLISIYKAIRDKDFSASTIKEIIEDAIARGKLVAKRLPINRSHRKRHHRHE